MVGFLSTLLFPYCRYLLAQDYLELIAKGRAAAAARGTKAGGRAVAAGLCGTLGPHQMAAQHRQEPRAGAARAAHPALQHRATAGSESESGFSLSSLFWALLQLSECPCEFFVHDSKDPSQHREVKDRKLNHTKLSELLLQ